MKRFHVLKTENARLYKKFDLNHVTDLCLLLLSGVDYRRAAHLCNLPALAVKGPATNLITNHILDEKHSAIEPQRQLVKQLNVLQHVIIRVATNRKSNPIR